MYELVEKAEIDDAFPDEHVLVASQDLIHCSQTLQTMWKVIWFCRI